jgi:hypothetical protein
MFKQNKKVKNKAPAAPPKKSPAKSAGVKRVY